MQLKKMSEAEMRETLASNYKKIVDANTEERAYRHLKDILSRNNEAMGDIFEEARSQMLRHADAQILECQRKARWAGEMVNALEEQLGVSYARRAG